MFKRLTVAFVGVAVFALLALLPSPAVAADTGTGTKAGTGSIKGTVLAADGKAAASVEVKLFKVSSEAGHSGHKAKGAAKLDTGTKAGKGKGEKHQAVQTTTTDEKGEFSFTGVEVGEYNVVAGGKGVGRGHTKVSVAANGTANVSITLKDANHAGKGGAKSS